MVFESYENRLISHVFSNAKQGAEMNKCDGCKHKDNCICVPYGCECFELDLEEHDKQIRAEVIDECKTLLKTSHMIRTTEDDFSAQIEIPFYRKLWKAFEELKEQSNGK